MAVAAHFYIAELTNFAYNPGNTIVKLRPSTKGEQNKTWAQATPSGEITMTIGNPAASDWFRSRLGRDVSIRFDDIVGSDAD